MSTMRGKVSNIVTVKEKSNKSSNYWRNYSFWSSFPYGHQPQFILYLHFLNQYCQTSTVITENKFIFAAIFLFSLRWFSFSFSLLLSRFRKRIFNLTGTQVRPRDEFFARFYEAANCDENYRREVVKSTAIFVVPGIHVLRQSAFLHSFETLREKD